MAVRIRENSALFGYSSGIGISVSEQETRDINLLIKPETVIVYTPATPPTVGQAWPRGNV